MKIADAHCDTLTTFYKNPFYSEDSHWSIPKFKEVGGILQFMAIFTDFKYSGDSAFTFAANCIGNFYKQKPDDINLLLKKEDFSNDKINILISLEGGSPVINDINNLYVFHKLGVRAMTLTWNHRNFIADGIENTYGLTVFGKEVVKEMEKLNMIVDVSHLNEAGFEDVCKITTKPFIASHSNSDTVHSHLRNLRDEQVKEIVNRGGFIGINLYSDFLGNETDDLKKMMLKHIEHFLKLGCENTLGLGADFDGIDKCPFENVLGYKEIENMLRNEMQLDDNLIDKILYKNLVDYTLKMI